MFKNFAIDHIGVAVRSLDQGFKFYQALGAPSMDVEVVPTEKVKVGFIRFKNQINVELLEPTSADSVISKFIDKRGEGIHHICYSVDDIRQVMADLKKAGLRVIDSEPRAGAHNCLVAFVHPSSCNGVLVELSQKPKGS